jgi:hypothetical protein
MPVTINPRPLLLELNRRPWNSYDTDQYAGPYTIEFTPNDTNRGRLSQSVKIEFSPNGPIDFMDGNGEFTLNESSYTIEGTGNFLFTVRVNAGILNDQTTDMDFTSLIKTTERTQLVKWHELTSEPGEAVEEGLPPDIYFPHQGNEQFHNPNYVEARVYLRSVEQGEGGLWYGTEVWPGGFVVGPASQEDENKMVDWGITWDKAQSENRKHLWLKFRKDVPADDYQVWRQNTNEGQFDNPFGNNLDPSLFDPLIDEEENSVYILVRPANSSLYKNVNGEELSIKFRLTWLA